MSAVKHTITNAEYEIMQILWRCDKKMTVSDNIGELKQNELTNSTVITFMALL